MAKNLKLRKVINLITAPKSSKLQKPYFSLSRDGGLPMITSVGVRLPEVA
jgi:hypothetical protein